MSIHSMSLVGCKKCVSSRVADDHMSLVDFKNAPSRSVGSKKWPCQLSNLALGPPIRNNRCATPPGMRRTTALRTIELQPQFQKYSQPTDNFSTYTSDWSSCLQFQHEPIRCRHFSTGQSQVYKNSTGQSDPRPGDSARWDFVGSRSL